MTINISNIAYTDILVAVRRYDLPEVQIGLHEYSNKQYVNMPRLVDASEAAIQIDCFFLADGYEEVDAFQIAMVDRDFYQLVEGSLPIEFHTSWGRGDVEMCDRIRVFVKNGAAPWDPTAPHCTKELRFRDGAGNDGGGHVQCLSELYENGTCPKTSLHHDVYVKTKYAKYLEV